MTGLAPFRAAADRQRARLARMLGEGRASATEIAVTRVAAVRMAELLATAPGSVLIYDRLGPDAMGMSGADRWTVDEINRAGNVVHPHEGTVEEVGVKRGCAFLEVRERFRPASGSTWPERMYALMLRPSASRFDSATHPHQRAARSGSRATSVMRCLP